MEWTHDPSEPQGPVPAALDQPGDDQVRRSRHRAAGHRGGGRAGDRPVARAGAGGRPRDRREAAHRLRSALHDALPRRVLHAPEGPRRRAAIDDNRVAIEEAATLAAAGAPGSTAILVLVAGGLPEGSRDLIGARERVRDAIGERSGCRGRGCDARDRAAASDVRVRPRGRLDARPGARHRGGLRPGRGRRDRRHVPHLVGPRRAEPDRPRRPRGPHRDLPGVRLEDPAARRRAARPALSGGRDHRLRLAHRCRARRRLSRRHRGGDLQRADLGGHPGECRAPHCRDVRHGDLAAPGRTRRLPPRERIHDGAGTQLCGDAARCRPCGRRVARDRVPGAERLDAHGRRGLSGACPSVGAGARLHRERVRAGHRAGHLGDHRAPGRRHRGPVLRPDRVGCRPRRR